MDFTRESIHLITDFCSWCGERCNPKKDGNYWHTNKESLIPLCRVLSNYGNTLRERLFMEDKKYSEVDFLPKVISLSYLESIFLINILGFLKGDLIMDLPLDSKVKSYYSHLVHFQKSNIKFFFQKNKNATCVGDYFSSFILEV